MSVKRLQSQSVVGLVPQGPRDTWKPTTSRSFQTVPTAFGPVGVATPP